MSPDLARRLAAAIDVEPLAETDALPVPWHWVYFVSTAPTSRLAADGLPIDPVQRQGYTKRLWTGSSLHVHRPLRFGAPAERLTREVRTGPVPGSGGARWFRRLHHRITQDGLPCIDEEDLVVYARAGDTRSVVPGHPAPDHDWREDFVTDPVQLFRFSALTYNAHRIHYDRAYATEVEHHPDLVVNGHLTALLLVEAVRRRHGPISSFACRAHAPLYVGRPASILGTDGEDGSAVVVLDDRGAIAMSATVATQPVG